MGHGLTQINAEVKGKRKERRKERFNKTKDNCFYSLCLSALVAKRFTIYE
jgi:hypothetical protein